MREFLLELRSALLPMSPTFLHVPQDVPYPHITLEPLSSLRGIPWGPLVLTFRLKIWSQYEGTREILEMIKNVEAFLGSYPKGSLKVLKSALTLLTDKKTRVHVFSVKARIADVGK